MLDPWMTLLVVMLSIEMVTLCPAFSLIPANRLISSVKELGKLISFDLE